jgi:hypothetical protein
MQYLHLTCERERLHALVETLKGQLSAREDVSLTDYGVSSKRVLAYIVIGWDSEIDESFLDQLLADPAILDLSIFTVPCSIDDLFSPLTYV